MAAHAVPAAAFYLDSKADVLEAEACAAGSGLELEDLGKPTLEGAARSGRRLLSPRPRVPPPRRGGRRPPPRLAGASLSLSAPLRPPPLSWPRAPPSRPHLSPSAIVTVDAATKRTCFSTH